MLSPHRACWIFPYQPGGFCSSYVQSQSWPQVTAMLPGCIICTIPLISLQHPRAAPALALPGLSGPTAGHPGSGRASRTPACSGRTALGLWCYVMESCTPYLNKHLCSWKMLSKGILKLSLPILLRESLTSMSIRPHNNNQMFQPGPDKLATGEQPVCFHSWKLDASR